MHYTFKALKVLYGFCTVSRLLITSTSVLGGLSPFFTVVFSFLLLGRGVGPTRTVYIVLTFINYLFIMGPKFRGTRLVPTLVNMYKKLNTKVTCAVIQGVNARKMGKPIVIFCFSYFSYVVIVP